MRGAPLTKGLPPSQSWCILYGSITKWGGQARSYILQSGMPINLLVEHHPSLKKLESTRQKMKRHGWKVFGVPARPTGRSKAGASGEAMAIYRPHLAMCHMVWTA